MISALESRFYFILAMDPKILEYLKIKIKLYSLQKRQFHL